MPGGWGYRKNSLVLRSKILKEKFYSNDYVSSFYQNENSLHIITCSYVDCAKIKVSRISSSRNVLYV